MLHETLSQSSNDLAYSLAGKLARLGPRQQEIAAIVYSSAAVTPREIQKKLSEPRSIRAVRTLLDRMVTKGLVKRRHSGRHREIVYIAAIPTPRVKEAAVQRLVDEQFGGSLAQAALAAGALAEAQARDFNRVPQNSAEVRRLATRAMRPGAYSPGFEPRS
jgi:predicted transcriptional regulator